MRLVRHHIMHELYGARRKASQPVIVVETRGHQFLHRIRALLQRRDQLLDGNLLVIYVIRRRYLPFSPQIANPHATAIVQMRAHHPDGLVLVARDLLWPDDRRQGPQHNDIYLVIDPPAAQHFIGELTILGGAFQMSRTWAVWGAVGIALGAAYLLWLFQRTMLGDTKERNLGLRDLSWREIAVFAPLVVWAFWIGLNPQLYFRTLDRSVAQIVERVHPGYYAERHLVNPLAPAGVPLADLK